MTSFALAAVAAALQRFPAFLVADHAAHSQAYDCEQYHQRNHCSHKESLLSDYQHPAALNLCSNLQGANISPDSLYHFSTISQAFFRRH